MRASAIFAAAVLGSSGVATASTDLHLPAELVLWRSPVSDHLYARSAWIKDQFDGASPSEEFGFELSRCLGTGPLAPHWVSRFEAEVKRAGPPPAGSAAAPDYALLRKMLERVGTQHALRLVIEAC